MDIKFSTFARKKMQPKWILFHCKSVKNSFLLHI